MADVEKRTVVVVRNHGCFSRSHMISQEWGMPLIGLEITVLRRAYISYRDASLNVSLLASNSFTLPSNSLSKFEPDHS